MLALKVLVLALAYLPCLVRSASEIVPGTLIDFVNTSSGTYAVRQHTAIEGQVLLEASANPQPDLAACAASCSRNTACNEHGGFNFCDQKGGCLLGGELVAQGSCQLLVPSRGQFIAIAAQAVGERQLGTAGVLMLIENPGELEGYIRLYARTLDSEPNLPCKENVSPLLQSCIVPMSLQEAGTFCNTMPGCQAMVYSPRGILVQEFEASLPEFFAPGNASGPLATMRGNKDGGKVSLNSTLLSNLGCLYIKAGQLATPQETNGSEGLGSISEPSSSEASEDGSSLSAGAIAGIVVGACCGAAVVAAAAVLLLHCRRKKAQGDPGPESSGKKTELSLPDYDDLERQPMAAANEALGSSSVPGAHGAAAKKSGELKLLTASTTLSSLTGQLAGPLQGSAQQSASSASAFRPLSPREAQDLNPSSPKVRLQLSEHQKLQLSDRAGSSSAGSGLGSSADQLLSRLPDDTWESCVVEFSHIHFCHTPEGKLVELGTGAFSTVYRVLLDGVAPYAAKVLPLGDNPKLAESFVKEVSMLRQVRHRNIVGFAGVCVAEGNGIILMELMEGRDLRSRLNGTNKAGERILAWKNRGKMVALDVARALHFLHRHEPPFVHFDIKASNVLLSRDLTAKVADVGFTRAMRRTHQSLSSSRLGTFDYMAPELLLGRTCTEAVDIYSWGILLWEMCTGEFPARGCMRPLQAPDECPQAVADLQLECVDEDPLKRPTARTLVERLLTLQREGSAPRPAPEGVAPSGGS